MSKVARGRGGSNYAWYNLTGCVRSPFGVLANYGAQADRDLINKQLEYMRPAQARLRIPIFHRARVNDGTNLDSTNGTLSASTLSNLVTFFATIKRLEFEEVIVSFHPQGQSSPLNWPCFCEPAYRENLAIISQIVKLLDDSGVTYWLDLFNEGIPDPSQSVLKQYTSQLWRDYLDLYRRVGSRSKKIGFSLIAGDISRLDSLDEIFTDDLPDAIDLHVYDNPDTVIMSASCRLATMPRFRGIPWIVGETFYDSRPQAEVLEGALSATGRQLLFLLQWPLTVSQVCRDVDVSAPLSFANYADCGF